MIPPATCAGMRELGGQTIMRRLDLAGQAPLITLIALCAVTALLTDRFLSPLNLTNVLVQSSIMPYKTPIGPTYDCGNFPKVFGRLMPKMGPSPARALRNLLTLIRCSPFGDQTVSVFT